MPAPAATARPAAPALLSGRWVLKRALVGLALLLAVSTTAALLLDAGIDPAEVQASE